MAIRALDRKAQAAFLASRSDDRPGPWGVGAPSPVYVHLLPKQLKHTFAIDGEISRLTVNDELRRLGTRLGFSPAVFSFAFTGYKLFECKNVNCDVEKVYTPMLDTGIYHPYRSTKHSARCVAQTLDVIDFITENIPADYAQFICLTAPGWVSKELLDHGTIGRFKKAIHYFLDNLHDRMFPRRPSHFGALYAMHTWRSSRPLEPHLHTHLILPNVVYNSVDKRFYRFNPSLDDRVVKECWREALVRVGFWDRCDIDLPDVHLQYVSLNPFDSTERARLVHHIKYIFRLPLADMNERLERRDVEVLDLDERFARYLFDYITRRHRLGWMTNLKRFGGGPVCSKSTSQPCPVCGTEMSYLGHVASNLPEVQHVFRDRTGVWVNIPPPFDPIPGDQSLIPSRRSSAPAYRADPDIEKRTRVSLRGSARLPLPEPQ